MLFHALIFPLSLISLVAGNPIASSESICKGNQVVTSTQFIGPDKNVKLETITCDAVNTSENVEKGGLLLPRQTPSVCGATCTTICFTPSGGGPDPNDCAVIANALRFDSANIAPIFFTPSGTNNTLSLTYLTCRSFFLNQATTALNYCRNDFAALISFIAPNCQATQNAHGGLCVATDGRWFVQVQHS
ncbi:hypothetical protein BDZ97DRAFT_1921531 [Flammula alnicola]|nr:hypothetical protein BDZ97DRAFT_1921531 [Flammula alnicola]